MEARYEHKTESEGASFDTDYKVITRCTPDCPACAFKAGIKEVVEWVEENHAHKGIRQGGKAIVANSVIIPNNQWQAKLKEWGLNDR